VHGRSLACQVCGSPLDTRRARHEPVTCPVCGLGTSRTPVASCRACGRDHCLVCGKLLDTSLARRPKW
jgi:hypothetical protein